MTPDDSRKVAKFGYDGRRCYELSIVDERLYEPNTAFLHTRLRIGEILEFVAANQQPFLHAVRLSEPIRQSNTVTHALFHRLVTNSLSKPLEALPNAACWPPSSQNATEMKFG